MYLFKEVDDKMRSRINVSVPAGNQVYLEMSIVRAREMK
jgi:hypothetical protein